MKKYIKDLEPKEIIDNLKKGLSIESDDSSSKCFMVDNIICYQDCDGHLFVNSDIPCFEKCWYFEIEEPFEIKEAGVYKTRNGKKAFVNCLFDETVSGVLEKIYDDFVWNKDGTIKTEISYYTKNKPEFDIVGKWED